MWIDNTSWLPYHMWPRKGNSIFFGWGHRASWFWILTGSPRKFTRLDNHHSKTGQIILGDFLDKKMDTWQGIQRREVIRLGTTYKRFQLLTRHIPTTTSELSSIIFLELKLLRVGLWRLIIIIIIIILESLEFNSYIVYLIYLDFQLYKKVMMIEKFNKIKLVYTICIYNIELTMQFHVIIWYYYI